MNLTENEADIIRERLWKIYQFTDDRRIREQCRLSLLTFRQAGRRKEKKEQHKTQITMANKNNNPNPQRSLSQKEQILAYLQNGGELTPLQALDLFGTTKLATRISELINEDGHTEIQKRLVQVTTRHGGRARVMSYFIQPMLAL